MTAVAPLFHPSPAFRLSTCQEARVCTRWGHPACRLSCEKFFVLASVFCAFLLFREPPLWVRHVISAVATLSAVFQKVRPPHRAAECTLRYRMTHVPCQTRIAAWQATCGPCWCGLVLVWVMHTARRGAPKRFAWQRRPSCTPFPPSAGPTTRASCSPLLSPACSGLALLCALPRRPPSLLTL